MKSVHSRFREHMARKIRKHALPGDIACCHGPGIKALNSQLFAAQCFVDTEIKPQFFLTVIKHTKMEASLFRTLDAIFTSTLCLDQGWRWLELLWLYW
ncbi:hypothetical protein EMCRGX_G014536 [Ephydatia muelleri]